MRNIVSILLCISLLNVVSAQLENQVFALAEFMDVVKNNHPVMNQAALQAEMASSVRKIAKGGFDPKLDANWNQKSFDEKNYYTLASGNLKIPTWYGIEVKAGYDRANGQFLNPSNNLPQRGLWNAGISVPLGKGFIIDDRRAALKRADIYQATTDQERRMMINDLLYEASVSYLNWQVSKAYFEIALEGVELARTRLTGTRSSFINGDKPAIDTLESFISLQSREMDLLKANQDLISAQIQLENYLWLDGDIPLELEEGREAEAINISLLEQEIANFSLSQDQRVINHPEILLYNYKLANYDIDLKLAKEELKPDLRVDYKPITALGEDTIFERLEPSNYKFGASISYPILQRKERGKIQLTKVKNELSLFDRTIKSQELKVKLDNYLNNVDQALVQNSLQVQILENYQRMLDAENQKLIAGESSIFLVNSREQKYLESRYKQIALSQKLLYYRFAYLRSTVGCEEVL